MEKSEEMPDICFYCKFNLDCDHVLKPYRGHVCVKYEQSEKFSPED